jgi:DNA replication protein DnaC
MIENIKNNKEQHEAFQRICNAVFDKDPYKCKCFFLDGPAGSGKTYLYNALIRYLKLKGKKVLAQATTGIASDLLLGGATMHSRFKIPLQLDTNSSIKMSERS